MGKMRFKISVDTEIPFEEIMALSVLLVKSGWRLTLADNGNIICEKEKQEKE